MTSPVSLSDDDFTRLLREALGDNDGPTTNLAALERIRAGLRPTFHLGVTGSRHLADDPQYSVYTVLLKTVVTEWFNTHEDDTLFHLHHGMCTGADEAAHWTLRGILDVIIHGHPGVMRDGSSQYRMRGARVDVEYPEKTYRDRNHEIVRMSTMLMAAPMYPEDYLQSKHSGTWQTIRLARKEGIPILIVWPNGGITHDKS